MKIALIAGTRPNFIKVAPLWKALRVYPEINIRLIHTGQHRDAAMSTQFIEDLGLPEPDTILAGNEKAPIRETARISLGLEPILEKLQPDWVAVIGDVTSTVAAALAAKQLGLSLAHVEAGLRSGDRNMPEELNRITTDHLSDVLFASEESAVSNLQEEGIPDEKIKFVGNILIDALKEVQRKAQVLNYRSIIAQTTSTNSEQNPPNEYALCTFHRPSNVDTRACLQTIYNLICRVKQYIPVVFPMHPRTLQNILQFDIGQQLMKRPDFYILPPICYSEMVCLMQNARFVLTDSGGIQEETSWLGIPCLTFRRTTERPATLSYGSNTLINDLNIDTVEQYIEVLLAGQYKTSRIPPLWDGKTAARIAAILVNK